MDAKEGPKTAFSPSPTHCFTLPMGFTDVFGRKALFQAAKNALLGPRSESKGPNHALEKVPTNETPCIREDHFVMGEKSRVWAGSWTTCERSRAWVGMAYIVWVHGVFRFQGCSRFSGVLDSTERPEIRKKISSGDSTLLVKRTDEKADAAQRCVSWPDWRRIKTDTTVLLGISKQNKLKQKY